MSIEKARVPSGSPSMREPPAPPRNFHAGVYAPSRNRRSAGGENESAEPQTGVAETGSPDGGLESAAPLESATKEEAVSRLPSSFASASPLTIS